MEVFAGHRALFRPLDRPAITIGNFDGVHIGHQRLLAGARSAATRLGGDAVAMSFAPHPNAYFTPDAVLQTLSSTARKIELFGDAGMNVAIIEPFDEDFVAISAEAFCQVVLHDILAAKHVVVGHDFCYGNDKRGDARTLRAAGQALGFTVEIIEPVADGGMRVSSSAVRQALIDGDLVRANRMLGRCYDVEGPVTRGAGRGRQLGIPTANVQVDNLLLPKPGVYATSVQILGSDKSYTAATNLGTNPTFVDGGALTLEAHLLDFSGDLYDRQLRVRFVKHLRGEMRFSGVDALIAQIQSDIVQARAAVEGE